MGGFGVRMLRGAQESSYACCVSRTLPKTLNKKSLRGSADFDGFSEFLVFLVVLVEGLGAGI